jgi:dual specificity protein phosphatase-like protein
MQEVYPNIFVGNMNDYETIVSTQTGWAIVHACKEPYHRKAVGYWLWRAPKNHPEYLIARRENRIMLSLLDLPIPFFIQKAMIDHTLDFIDEMRASGLKVMIHCVAGRSRSPSITLLYLATRLNVLPTDSFEAAEQHFRNLYPLYRPSRGIREHIKRYWQEYCDDGRRCQV